MQKVRATVYDFTTTLKVLAAKRCTKWWQCLLAVCCCCAIWDGRVLSLDIKHSRGREHSSACGHKRHPYKHKPTHTHTNTLTCGWRWQPHTLVHLQCRHSRCSGTFYAFPTKVNSVGASHKLHFHTNASRWLFAPASQHMENDIEMQHSSALCRRSKYAFAKMPHILYISRYVCVCLLAVAAVTAMTATCRLCVVNVFSKAFTTFSKFSMLCCNVVAAAAATASQRHRQFYSLPSLVCSLLVCSIVGIFVVRILFDNYCCCLFCFCCYSYACQ